jgi:2-polyprenyl-3-methyl-5-hydroxy-6-metoxy-1,4-benzoquinol methylase
MSYSINNKFKPCLVKLLGIFDNRINGELDIHLLGEKQLTVISEIIAQPLIATRNVELYTYTIIISFLKEYPLPKDESYLVKLIHSVLRKDFVKNYDIECRFIRLRKQLLIKALDKTNHSNKSFLRLANSIAIQVRLNNFLWDISESEFQIVQNVKAAFYEVSLPLEKEFSVAIVAMYEMHLKEEFIPWVKDETLKHYFTEEQVAIKIDEVTENLLAVKQQYEFFPYPMWQGVNQIVPKSLNSWVEVMFPKQFVNFPKTNHRVLIAGTGTGRHAIQVALRHPEIQVVGIDLSIQSLRYAKKQANKLGISNIDFKQKDILALNAKEKFAMIECVGVLHHLPNPKEGLIKLQNALEFGGILKLGLYSKKAREPLIEVKKEFEVPNKTQEIEVIRKMRSEMLKKANQEYLFYAMRFTEFFNLNGFVDLFLHASEINYTFPMLKNLLSDCELSYVKFDLSNKKNLNINYRAENTFAFWEEVESKDPTFFKSMYLFWCVKD